MKNYLVKNSKTDYVVLVPEKTDTFVDFAVKTLVDAVEKSTGVKLEITNQANGKKFISIGETEAKKSANVKTNYGKDGFKAVEKD
ncbi:MAG: hypothetical protein IKC83_00320 [Clostridia bacterium]|nr:hypothetical protein [Clostridia bacterium]